MSKELDGTARLAKYLVDEGLIFRVKIHRTPDTVYLIMDRCMKGEVDPQALVELARPEKVEVKYRIMRWWAGDRFIEIFEDRTALIYGVDVEVERRVPDEVFENLHLVGCPLLPDDFLVFVEERNGTLWVPRVFSFEDWRYYEVGAGMFLGIWEGCPRVLYERDGKRYAFMEDLIKEVRKA